MNIIPSHDDWHVHNDDLSIERMSMASRLAVIFGVFTPLVGLIVAIVLLWTKGMFTLLDLSLLVGMYMLTVSGVTVGFHRLFTHKSYETTRFMKGFLAIAGSMSLQGPVIKWCAVHRRHHQASDHEGDPHSPHLHGDSFWGMLKGMIHAHMGWIFEPDPEDIRRSVKDLAADPMLLRINNLFPLWVAIGMLLPAGIGLAVTHSWLGAFTGFLWGGLVRACLMHHVTWSINSVCHVFGSRPFESQDHSRNNFPIAIISLGEGWHNNHHAFPTSARHGLHWWQIDISYMFIRSMSFIGLAWDLRTPPKSALAAKRRRPPTPASSPSLLLTPDSPAQ